jgi:hypothetical protein
MRKVENMNQEKTALEYMQTWIHRLLIRKRKLLGLFVWIFLLAGLFQVSCKKTESIIGPEVKQDIQEARSWFTKEVVQKEKDFLQLKKWTGAKDSVARLFARMAKLEKVVDWQLAKNFSHNGWNYVVAPVDELESAFANKRFLRGRALVIHTSPEGVRDLTIVEVLAKPGTTMDLIQLVHAGFLNRHQLASERVGNQNAELLFYDRGYRHEMSRRLVNGAWESSNYMLRIKVGAASRSRMMASFSQSTSCSNCSTWYLVGFFYDMQTGKVDDYSILTQWEECTTKELDPSYGDGGSSGDNKNCIDECVEDASDLSSEGKEVSQTVSIRKIQYDQMRKEVLLKWKVLQGLTWSVYSYEKGMIRLTGLNPTTWVWESLTHERMGVEGFSIAGSIEVENDMGIPSFTPGTKNVRYAGMEVTYTMVFTPVCGNCGGLDKVIGPIKKSYKASALWIAAP